MFMNNEKTTSGGIGFGSTILLIFIILKLVGVIDWSWWWVLSPIWIPVVLLMAVSILLFVVYRIVKYFRLKNGLRNFF